ncbi:hypothetical protein NMY22_g5359 [Coprinellus aureogranulatus]|nr:hypothetical protein NMY22_g5359 [Coprinellus aureogranulatus]
MPHRAERGGSSAIPAVILSQARNGVDVGQLYDIVSPQNCTPEVIEIVFSHLPLEGLPPTRVVGRTSFIGAERALAALTVLSKVTFAAYSNPHAKEYLVARSIESVDAICLWMDFSLPHGLVQVTPHNSTRVELRRAHLFQAETLQDLLHLDQRIHTAFASSPVFVRLVIRIWTELNDDAKLCMNLGGGNGCPVIRTMLKATETEDGKEAFVSELTYSPTKAASFAACTVQRATQIADEGLDAHPLPVIIRHVCWLLDIVDRFVSSNTTVWSQFSRSGYVKTYTALLNSISFFAVEHGTPELLIENLRGVCGLMTLIADQNSRIVRNRCEVVSGDMMSLLARTVGYLAQSNDSKAVESGIAVVQMFSEYTLYPKVLEAIHKLKPPKFGVATMPRDSPMFKIWHGFFMSFVIREQLPYPSIVRLCDNITCNVRHSGPWKSKQCSRCSSVVYCSEVCQKQDWNRWHKSECSAAREIHTVRRLSESWYSHTIRAFHTGFIDEFFSQNLSEIDNPESESESDQHPSPSIRETLPVVEFTDVEALLDYQSLTKPQWWRRPDVEFKQTYLWPRLTLLGEMFRRGKAAEGLRLVEAVFPMGADWEVL